MSFHLQESVTSDEEKTKICCPNQWDQMAWLDVQYLAIYNQLTIAQQH